MFRTSIFAFIAAAMTFAAEGVSITVNATVDSHIGSVTVKKKLPNVSQTLGTVGSGGSASWTAWEVGTAAYTAEVSSVSTGYTARWSVTKSGQTPLSGGTNDTITIPTTAYSGCTLSFYGEPNTYRVDLDRQSGSGGSSYVTATYDAAMPSANMPTRTGYEFGGYYTAENGGGTKYYNADGSSARTWNIPSNTTLYAKWTAQTYNVTLDPQPGSGGSPSVTATYDAAMPAITIPTQDGFAFGGYFSGSGGTGTQYYNADGSSARTWNIDSDRTLYAKWSAHAYTITLDKQGGNGGTGSVNATYGSPLSSITKPTRGGYAFGGYYAGQEGSGKQYYDASGRSVVEYSDFTSNATIYAYWIQNPTVTLDPNGGELLKGWTTTTNYAEGVGMRLPSATEEEIAYTNRIFDGWYYRNGTGPVTMISSTDRGNKEFIAHWSGATYTVNFNANGGSGQGSQPGLDMTGAPTLTRIADLNIVRQGYTFDKWTTEANGSGASYADGAVIPTPLTTVPGDIVTLYAQWTPNAYVVAFNANGADGGETMVNQAFVYDVTQNLDHVGFTYAGYAFERWSTDTNYNYQTKYHLDGAAVANLATGGVVNLYANWTGIVYTVRFDANGGTGVMDPMTCTYGKSTNLIACAFARDGWGFKGWTNSLAEGVLFADRARVTNLTTSAEVTLLACWTGVTYSVTLDARDQQGNDKNNGVMTNGTGNAVNVLTNDYTVGDAWSLPEPTNLNTHLVFAGWTYGNGHLAGNEVPPPSSGATNLVAKWSRKADALAAAVDAPLELEFETFGSESEDEKMIRGSLSADWFPQTNDYIFGTNAVQSGALPETGARVYGTWMTTTVTGKGVLSFSWKCDARQREWYESYGSYSGESLRFGLFDEAKGITNQIALIEGQTGWQTVTYTNESDSAVSFAWAFVFRDFGDNNGGGTGLVDHVDWKPDGYSGEVTAAHSVPFAWLRDNFPGHDSAGASELETLAEGNSPNGKAWPDGTSVKVWEDYWAGTDPNDPDDLFRALITMNDGVPSITPCPDMSTGTPERVYWVQGAPIVPARDWARVLWPPDPSDPAMATNRFFKLELDWEESLKK